MNQKKPSLIPIPVLLVAHLLIVGCSSSTIVPPPTDEQFIRRMYTANPACKVDGAPGTSADTTAIAHADKLSPECFIKPDPPQTIVAAPVGSGQAHGNTTPSADKLLLVRGPHRKAASRAKVVKRSNTAQAARRAKSFKADMAGG